MDEYSSLPNHLAPNAAAKKPREFWILKQNIADGNAVTETPDYPELFIHVIEASYAKELEAEVERLKRLLEVSEEDYSRYIRCSTEKLAVAVADLSKINKIVGAIPFSDQDKWGSTLEIVWGISSKYRDARASIRGKNG